MKQKNIPLIGAFMESFFVTLPLFSIFSTIAIVIVLYANIQQYLIRYLPWITLWWFLLILAAVGLTGMLLVYKFVLRSIWSFREKQMSHLEQKIDELTELVKGKKDA